MPNSTIAAAKQAVRERVWNLLEAEHTVEPGVHGHIPDFAGAEAAAERLAGLYAWKNAKVIKAVPDTAKLPRASSRSLATPTLKSPNLHDAGVLGPDAVIATTVHSHQVLDEELPATTISRSTSPSRRTASSRAMLAAGAQLDDDLRGAQAGQNNQPFDTCRAG